MSEPNPTPENVIHPGSPLSPTRTVWDYVKPTVSPTPSAPISAGNSPAPITQVVSSLPGLTTEPAQQPDTPQLGQSLAASVAAVAGSEATAAIADAHNEASTALRAEVAERATSTIGRVPEPVRQQAQNAYAALPDEHKARLADVARVATERVQAAVPAAAAPIAAARQAVPAPAPGTAQTGVPHYATLSGPGVSAPNGRRQGGTSLALAIIAGVFSFIPFLSYAAIGMSIGGWVLGSRARKNGSAGLGTTGLILSIFAFVGSVFFSFIYTIAFIFIR
ncbi:hypothetical protein [Agromyces atrinae]|uniref:DUF4190 domain-containing protein n=1 Tax=Agromyces atrinae TaxID=592376 RepID=A0A4Q2M8G9_9MICO|nr:hypothetical protein [Agromyces atrinae]NYD65625.1 hypothetical protein [Agromyces atrinae]RXZ85430.1 hypothetical protein ESP50_14550 [Agromyces atrinae]